MDVNQLSNNYRASQGKEEIVQGFKLFNNKNVIKEKVLNIKTAVENALKDTGMKLTITDFGIAITQTSCTQVFISFDIFNTTNAGFSERLINVNTMVMLDELLDDKPFLFEVCRKDKLMSPDKYIVAESKFIIGILPLLEGKYDCTMLTNLIDFMMVVK